MSETTTGDSAVLLEQLNDRLGRMETKLDAVVELKPRVDVNDREIKEIKEKQAAQATQCAQHSNDLAAMKAQADLLKLMFVVFVGPLVVALGVRGLWALFGGN